jgi:hypothetical protein
MPTVLMTDICGGYDGNNGDVQEKAVRHGIIT